MKSKDLQQLEKEFDEIFVTTVHGYLAYNLSEQQGIVAIGVKQFIKKAYEAGRNNGEMNIKPLHLEDHNFRIDSDNWKRRTDEDNEQDYLVNPEGDVWELINCEDRKKNGEQLFTFDSMKRETEKAGKRVPTDQEFGELLKTWEDMHNLVFTGYRDPLGYFKNRSLEVVFWSSSESGSNAWTRLLVSSEARVNRNAESMEYGFSVRCFNK